MLNPSIQILSWRKLRQDVEVPVATFIPIGDFPWPVSIVTHEKLGECGHYLFKDHYSSDSVFCLIIKYHI